jgi:hypothetical protein
MTIYQSFERPHNLIAPLGFKKGVRQVKKRWQRTTSAEPPESCSRTYMARVHEAELVEHVRAKV